MSKRRVVITGVGAVSPLATGAEASFERWTAGECAIEDGKAPCRGFEPTEVLSRKLVHRTDRVSHLTLAAAAEAADQSGWTEDVPYDPDRVGCIIGTGIGGVSSLITGIDVVREYGLARMPPLTVPMMMANAPSALVAMRYGLRGPAFATSSACAAGAHAIGTAVRMIQCGDVDAAVAGGAEATLLDVGLAAFRAIEALSPSGYSRPFDARRDGFVMGEGAGVLVLEAAEHAAARGATVLAELAGYGANVDAHHMTRPDGQGAAKAISLAMNDAGIAPEDIDYINAHGTATVLNDLTETAAIKTSLNAQAHRVPVSSTKSAIGHLLGASGAVEAVLTVLTLMRRTAGPTLGYREPDEGLDLDYVPEGARPLDKPKSGEGSRDRLFALSNSFGFGGHNAVLCLATC